MAGFPNFTDKHAHEAVISPTEVVAASRENPELLVPNSVILTYQRLIPEYLIDHGGRLADGYPSPWKRMWLVERRDREPVGVVNGFGIGAPAAAALLEELIALGAHHFVSMGEAGCLQPEIGFGDIVVASAAIRDEGLSHHYLPAEKFAYPSQSLTARLAGTLEAHELPYRSGPTWTIDAVYRETVAEARSYQAEGVLTVEMEAAALFAVACYRNVHLASAFVVSDHLLAAEHWTNAFGSQELIDGTLKLLEATLDALGHPPQSAASAGWSRDGAG